MLPTNSDGFVLFTAELGQGDNVDDHSTTLPTSSQACLELLRPQIRQLYDEAYAHAKSAEDSGHRPDWTKLYIDEYFNNSDVDLPERMKAHFDRYFEEVTARVMVEAFSTPSVTGVPLQIRPPERPPSPIVIEVELNESDGTASPPPPYQPRLSAQVPAPLEDSDNESGEGNARLPSHPGVLTQATVSGLGLGGASHPGVLTQATVSGLGLGGEVNNGGVRPRSSSGASNRSTSPLTESESGSDNEQVRSPPSQRSRRESESGSDDEQVEPPPSQPSRRSSRIATSSGRNRHLARGKNRSSSSASMTGRSMSMPSGNRPSEAAARASAHASTSAARQSSSQPRHSDPGPSSSARVATSDNSLPTLSNAARLAVCGSRATQGVHKQWEYRGLLRWSNGLSDESLLTFDEARRESEARGDERGPHRWPHLRERWECRACGALRHEFVGSTTNLSKHSKTCSRREGP